MDISFIVLTWNSEKFIYNCLKSLFDALSCERLSYEIFIIDNGSSDQSVPIIRSFQNQQPDCIFPIYLKENMGTTCSRNLALRQARGKYLCIMDSDVEIPKGILGGLISTFETTSRAGLVAPKLVYPNGTLQKSTDAFPTFFTKMFRYFFLKIVEKKENVLGQRTEPHEVDYAISAMWVIRQEAAKRIGLMDEKIFYAPEDVDYCVRLWKAGYKVIYNPRVSAIHHTQEISRGVKINTATFHHIQGLFYYFTKHHCWFKRPRITQ